jgi:SAM-dependent methyltransferase
MDGARDVVRFNWPTYALAVVVAAACLLALPHGGWLAPLAVTALLGTVYLTVASIVVSHWVYDRSPIADWTWLADWLASPARGLAVQAGFDATHGRLARLLPALTVVDLYGTPGVGGASVERARRLHPASVPALSALPSDAGACDAAVAAFALHEIRDADDRAACFRSLAQALAPGGRLLVVEHLRDVPNLLAFGPGAFHFLPEREWRRCADAAGLRLARSGSITPFVRAFLWTKP